MKGFGIVILAGMVLLIMLALAAAAMGSSASAGMSAQAQIQTAEALQLAMWNNLVDKLIRLVEMVVVLAVVFFGGIFLLRGKKRKWASGPNAGWRQAGDPRLGMPQMDPNTLMMMQMMEENRQLRIEMQNQRQLPPRGW